MLTNTKIFVRLAALVAALLVLMAGVAVVGILGLSDMKERLQTVYVDRVVPLKDLSKITDSYYRVRIIVVETVNSTDTAVIAKNKEGIDGLLTGARETWTEYLKTYLTPEEKTLAGEADQAIKTYDGVRERVLGTLLSGDFVGGKDLAKREGGPALAAVMGKIEELTALQVRVAEEEYNAAQDGYSSDRMLLIGGLAFAALVGASVAILIARSVTVPLRRIIDVMAALTSGTLAVEVKGSERGDEVGEVAKAVLVFKDGLVEAERLRHEQEEAKKRAELERRQMMLDLANRFEAGVGGVLSTVTGAATELQATAGIHVRHRRGDDPPVGRRRDRGRADHSQRSDRRLRHRRAVDLDSRNQRTCHRVQSHRRRSGRPGERHQQQGAGLGRRRKEDRRSGQPDQRHRRPDQPAGAQRHHRGGPRRRSRQGFRRRRVRGQGARQPDGARDRGDRDPGALDPGCDAKAPPTPSSRSRPPSIA